MAGISKHRLLVFGLCGIGFLGSEVVVQSILWPRFGPTVSVLAGLVPFVIFGAVINRIDDRNLKPEPLGHFRGRTALKAVVFVFWAIGMASWFPMAEIESSALSQPDRPTAQFIQPLHLKGVVRYVTPRQALIDEWSHRMFVASWLIGGVAAITYFALEKRQRSKAR